MSTCVLITGAASYVGAQVALAFTRAHINVIGLDTVGAGDELNQPASHPLLSRLSQLCGTRLLLEAADLNDQEALSRTFRRHRPVAVIHLAQAATDDAVNTFSGSTARSQSVRANLQGKLKQNQHLLALTNVLNAMQRHEVKLLLLGSSAAVYGAQPAGQALHERLRPAPVTDHARSLWWCEQLVQDVFCSTSKAGWRYGVLRHFTPIGADISGLVGLPHWHQADNLIGHALQAAVGLRDDVPIFGTDWPTADGTAVRDFIHVADVARAYLLAFEALARGVGPFTLNVGSGRGTSVMQLLDLIEQVTRRPLPVCESKRRAEDVAEIIADCQRAKTLLSWSPQYSLPSAIRDTWRYMRLNRQDFLASKETNSRVVSNSSPLWHGS